MAGKGFTDKGNRITPTSPFDWDTGAKLSAGEGAGTSDTTEATQLLVKTAVETTATNSTALAKAEDAAHASGDKGIMALVVRKDTATALAGTDGDYAPLEVDASGRLWVNVGTMAALPAGTNNIGDVDIASAIPAGTNLIGKVGIDQATPGTTNGVVMVRTNGTPVDPDEPAEVVGLGAKVAATPTTTNGAYAAGNIIGGKLTFANMARVSGGGGWLQAVTVGVKAAVTPALELWLFDADPSATTVADNAAWSLNVADLGKAFAVVSIAAGDWKDGGTPNVASIEYLRKYTLGATSMYGYLVDRTGTTLTSTSDIVVTLQAALD
ncbi:MAG: hypothetical protein V4820_11570 [Pseudomonadota bacterium]